MTARPVAHGVLAAGTLFYAALILAAAIIIVAAPAGDRLTLLVAGVVVVLIGGLAAALIVGLMFVPAYLVAGGTARGAVPYLVWGAALFGVLGWRFIAPDSARPDLALLTIAGCVAMGALEGAAFHFGVRRSMRDAPTSRALG